MDKETKFSGFNDTSRNTSVPGKTCSLTFNISSTLQKRRLTGKMDYLPDSKTSLGEAYSNTYKP
jgi:hypothetical protein